MDCSKTDNTWFEVRGWLAHASAYGGWEEDINQETCTGEAGLPPPRHSSSHLARCGYINVFEWGEGSCIIEPIPDDVMTTPDVGKTTVPPVARTVIFLEAQTNVGEDIFIRGGLQATWVPSGC